MAVMIGVDPHKGSHTAVAVDDGERSLAELRVRSGPKQLERLVEWAERFAERTWAIEGAERARLPAGPAARRRRRAGRRRAAEAGRAGAAAGDRSRPTRTIPTTPVGRRRRAALDDAKEVGVEDHAAVMKLWAKRHRNLSSSRTRVACRLHAVLCELVPGGVAGEIYAEQAARCSTTSNPTARSPPPASSSPSELVADLRRVDAPARRVEEAARAGRRRVGHHPHRHVRRRPDRRRHRRRHHRRHRPLPDPRPLRRLQRHRTDRGVLRRAARCSGSPGAGTAASTTPSTWPPSPRSASATAPAAPTTTARSPKARLRRKRSGRSSDASATPSGPPCRRRPTCRRPRRRRSDAGPGGHPGNDSVASAAGSHPEHRLFGQATPGPDRTLRPPARRRDARRRRTPPTARRTA